MTVWGWKWLRVSELKASHRWAKFRRMNQIKGLIMILILSYGIIFCTLRVQVYTQKVNNIYKIKKSKMSYVHIRFPGQCNIVECTVHTTFFDLTILHWHSDLMLHVCCGTISRYAHQNVVTISQKLTEIWLAKENIIKNWQHSELKISTKRQVLIQAIGIGGKFFLQNDTEHDSTPAP